MGGVGGGTVVNYKMNYHQIIDSTFVLKIISTVSSDGI